MDKGLALLTLREKMTDPVFGPPEEPDFLYSVVDFLGHVNPEELTEENILDKYILFLEDVLGIQHLDF